MLVTETQATAIAWAIGGTLMVIGGLLAWWLHRDERRGAGPVFLVLVLVGYAIAISTYANGTRVLLMKGDEAGYVRSELRLYGSKPYVFGSGRTEVLRWLGSRHIIVNDTTRTLMLRRVQYGYGLSSDTPIPSSESYGIDGFVEHFGPTDRPQSSIETTRYGATKYWLYW